MNWKINGVNMEKTLRIWVKDGYEYVSIAGKIVRSAVALVFTGIERIR